ncbi:MAG: peptide chain release factor 2 [Elusimicrobia bacterium CG08_land_8_20_14_0_20_44_26]|nr:MAG: peptide chain release factor 2 [Elusimicrobia bacterium CG08_land_8_20_14_0_20_44_26]
MDKEMIDYIEKIKKEAAKLETLADFKKMEEEISALAEKTLKEGFWNDTKEAGAVMKELENKKKDFETYKKVLSHADDFFEMAKMYTEDENFLKELQDDAAGVLAELKSTNIKLQFKDPSDEKGAIVTLHSGAGGTEACDWCEMIFRMYSRWCERKGFANSVVDILPGEEAGIKCVTFEVKGRFACGYMKSEIGVHRLVRISPFDSNKRRHTSFASCDVIPEIDSDIEIEIKPEDIKIDTYRSSGKGGQHVNKTDSAVRITHIRTGIVTSCQNERSQHQNKETAMKLLKAKLYALEIDKQKEQSQRRYDNMGQIGWGHQIRSYVFMPYQMVKDLRTGYETGNINAVMDGDIDGFIEAFLTSARTFKK